MISISRFDRYYNLRWDLTRSLNLDFSAAAFARVDEPFGALNTKEKKDSVRTNFLHAGRNTMYQQHATLSYNIPLAKFPALDWINARYSYTASYNWIGASLLAVNFW
jgi:cell surface protein SprA